VFRGDDMPKLLIVDDESDIREFAKRFFEKRKITVMAASGGNEALQLIDQEKPDLVLLDVRMEEMTGIEVLKKLRVNHNDVKVIMVTGVEDEAVINEANSCGILGYIHKPLVLDELEKIVLKELKVS
jgi:DNA-binding NtrC family response regulator